VILLRTHGKIYRYFFIFTAALLLILFIINNSTSVLRLSYPLKYKENVYAYSSMYKVDPYLVFSIIKAESSFNPDATSHKNARGLMQISEPTGKWGAEKLKLEGYNNNKLYNPDVNIKIGCWYLNSLMKEFGNNLDLVLAAYNSGSGNVNEWLKNKEYSESGISLDKIPFKETDQYVKRVKNNYSVYRRLYTKDY
jgi:soluble lytic murein transglycosylase